MVVVCGVAAVLVVFSRKVLVVLIVRGLFAYIPDLPGWMMRIRAQAGELAMGWLVEQTSQPLATKHKQCSQLHGLRVGFPLRVEMDDEALRRCRLRYSPGPD